jgi:hypothetical protein
MPMSEQYEVMETVEEAVEEVVDTPVDEPDVDLETEPEETVEEDYSEADKSFLDRFEIQFDKGAKKFESLEQLKEAAEMGSALPRYKDKVSTLENNPAYKWVDKYMKESGYSDPSNFVKAIEVNAKTEEFVNKGMSQEDAVSAAEEFVSRNASGTDLKGKEIDSFLEWHNGKVESGKFTESLDASNIPQTVQDAYENGQSLKEAYMDYILDDIKVKTEQDTLKKIAKNKETSAGALRDGKPNNTKDMTVAQVNKTLSNMSTSEQGKWLDANWGVVEKSGYFK